MKDGFLKAAALSPALRVADCAYNTRQILTELRAAAARGVKLAVFPEFCLTGYTCGDLFLQRTLQQGAEPGLPSPCDCLHGVGPAALVGVPATLEHALMDWPRDCIARGSKAVPVTPLCAGAQSGCISTTFPKNHHESPRR